MICAPHETAGRSAPSASTRSFPGTLLPVAARRKLAANVVGHGIASTAARAIVLRRTCSAQISNPVHGGPTYVDLRIVNIIATRHWTDAILTETTSKAARLVVWANPMAQKKQTAKTRRILMR